MTDYISLDEYRASLKRGAKYHNTRADGYDSQAERARHAELMLMEQAGAISNLRRQPRYVLQEAFTTYRAENIRAIVYVGDFEYREGGRVVCEDVKGVRTEVFKLKAKLFKWRYPDIELRVVEVSQ